MTTGSEPLGERRLSIVLPAFNEESAIAASLRAILDFCRRELSQWEVIVVDDGSTDGTASIVESFEEVRCLRNRVNQGKGRSVRRGMLEATCCPVLFTDVDLSTPIEEALELLHAIDEGADLALASRWIGGGKTVERTGLRRFVAAGFRGLVKLLVLRGIHDTQCGFKIFRRDAARKIFSLQRLDGWAFDVEILFIARGLGYTLKEVPVEWHESTDSRLSLWSPLEMLRDLFRIRWFQLTGRYRGESGRRSGF